MNLRTKTTAVCAMLATSVALSACGGSSTVSAASYMKSFCQALGPFEKDIRNRETAAYRGLTSTRDPAQGKKIFQTYLAGELADTEQVVSRLTDAGTPAVSNGKQISTQLVSAFSQLRGVLQRAQGPVNSLPTSSLQSFKTAAIPVATNIKNSAHTIGTTLSGLNNPQLDAAAKKEPACQSLSSTSTTG